MSGGVVGEEDLLRLRYRAKRDGLRFVFTNGCFDLLHAGHLKVLEEAKRRGDVLVVGVNGDDSVRCLKGEGRPLTPAAHRAALVAALAPVDHVIIFHEETPARLIDLLIPDVLVKGGDYAVADIVGAETVIAAGGEVAVVPLLEGFSTSALIEAIVRLGAGGSQE